MINFIRIHPEAFTCMFWIPQENLHIYVFDTAGNLSLLAVPQYLCPGYFGAVFYDDMFHCIHEPNIYYYKEA